ncbi:hypothetical protein DFH09DRAFT_1094791 [Mycena vulgaris]|nr:hypothetical protein DFH09DRAFT_1094791 [Mycena vulgaris]
MYRGPRALGILELKKVSGTPKMFLRPMVSGAVSGNNRCYLAYRGNQPKYMKYGGVPSRLDESHLRRFEHVQNTLIRQGRSSNQEVGNERLVKDGLLDSLDLARQLKLSWINDIVIVLADLPISVYWKVMSDAAVAVKTIDGLLADVKHSMEACIHAELSAYSRTRDLLPDRLVMEGGKWVHKVLAFRTYLRVQNNKHRVALTHAVLSGHALAMEQM